MRRNSILVNLPFPADSSRELLGYRGAMPRFFQTHERLRDGGEVTLRPIRPADAPRLREFNSRLSPRTRYLRFFTDVQEPPDGVLDYLVNVDYYDRYALVAEVDGEIAGVARFDRTGADRAEMAIVVRDDFQSRGLGSLLITKLASIARRRGIVTFEGDVLAENLRMFELVRRAGGLVSEDLTEQSIMADLNWPEPSSTEPEVRRVEIPLAQGLQKKLLQYLAATGSVLLPTRETRTRWARLAKSRLD